jgi:catechol 2,3-dioxygenase-like lactoylglutathione lyase family enzyme
MHRILLRTIVVDVPADAHDRTRDFWATALAGVAHRSVKYPEDHWLEEPATPNHVLIQNIGDDSARVHVDIETDDIEAEVARLTAAGAIEVDRQGNWVVLRDPAGLLFCVVPVYGEGFAEQSTVVDD